MSHGTCLGHDLVLARRRLTLTAARWDVARTLGLFDTSQEGERGVVCQTAGL